MEQFWNDWRNHVTHNHGREYIRDFAANSDACFAHFKCNPQRLLQTLGSPFAKQQENKT